MWEEKQTDVLVVGAGPVGMLTASLLAEGGLKVIIIDVEWRTAAHSYACALHPCSLRILHRLGLADSVIKHGCQVQKIGFYEGTARRAEINLAKMSGPFPVVTVLKQSALEGVLEEKLKHQGVKILWNHHLSDLRMETDRVVANIEMLAGTATGYIVPRWEMVTRKEYEIQANFVVGADGHESTVRRLLGIEQDTFGQPQIYAVYEFASEASVGQELRLVFDETQISALWPMPENQYRWSFQLGSAQTSADALPNKNRRPVRFYQEKADQENRQQLKSLIAQRAPWFKGNVGEMNWSLQVRFGSRLVRQYGRDRCWLVGDAAHQTIPVGIQSMNIGLREAESLAAKIKTILRDKVNLNLLESYQHECRQEWLKLLGQQGDVRSNAQTDPWIKGHAARFLSSLPASGEDLGVLLKQIGLELPA